MVRDFWTWSSEPICLASHTTALDGKTEINGLYLQKEKANK